MMNSKFRKQTIPLTLMVIAVSAILLLISEPCIGQENIDTSKINHYDEQGKKHGLWMKFYNNGKPAYIGHFEHGEPVGTMKRYFSSGDLKAKMDYKKNDKVYTKLYYPDHSLAAEGLYKNQQKDSTWKYYAEKQNMLKSIENYKDGVLHGKNIIYYKNGQMVELKIWKNGEKDGIWKTYYPDGSLRTETKYTEGELNGFFNAYWQNGMPEIMGEYSSGLKENTWKYYDRYGNLQDSIVYQSGIPENREELDQKTYEQFEKYEKNRHNIRDPREMPYQ